MQDYAVQIKNALKPGGAGIETAAEILLKLPAEKVGKVLPMLEDATISALLNSGYFDTAFMQTLVELCPEQHERLMALAA